MCAQPESAVADLRRQVRMLHAGWEHDRKEAQRLLRALLDLLMALGAHPRAHASAEELASLVDEVCDRLTSESLRGRR